MYWFCMAIKDWRKIKGRMTWVKKDNEKKDFKDKESVTVGGQLYAGSEYFIHISKKNSRATGKSFKTKAAAISFAKLYMRKH